MRRRKGEEEDRRVTREGGEDREGEVERKGKGRSEKERRG